MATPFSAHDGAVWIRRLAIPAVTCNARRLDMMDHLDHMMLRIDAHRGLAASILSDLMQNVIDPPRALADRDHERLRVRWRADGHRVAYGLRKRLDRPVEWPAPLETDHPVKFARHNVRRRDACDSRLPLADPADFRVDFSHTLLQREFGVRHAGDVDSRWDFKACAGGQH